ncbi:hypothetical protein AXF42_Ash009229 [Apostasia shenzhenica]|uniref:Uncharacterized protein n=1 Tax=Apostasia shenzhenica TaxID=1088818 RepID=A0A2I0B3I4_9ASPA|nr:hypothetical protein AXF42_Ash009229 [Apostasia shenzhenica]
MRPRDLRSLCDVSLTRKLFWAFGTPGIACCGGLHKYESSGKPRIAFVRMLDWEIWTALAVFVAVSSCCPRNGRRCLAPNQSSRELLVGALEIVRMCYDVVVSSKALRLPLHLEFVELPASRAQAKSSECILEICRVAGVPGTCADSVMSPRCVSFLGPSGPLGLHVVGDHIGIMSLGRTLSCLRAKVGLGNLDCPRGLCCGFLVLSSRRPL